MPVGEPAQTPPTTGGWTVASEDAGVRLDKFLAATDRLVSRGRAVSALERGKVFVNRAEASRADAARPLAAGDLVQVWIDRPGSARRSGPIRVADLEILYEDRDVVVLNKPAGLLAVPLDRRSAAPSVYELLIEHLRGRGRRRPFVVHRIDRDTSGLVLFATNPRAQQYLRDQFRRHEPERIYWAIVYGRPQPAEGSWRDHLVWDKKALIQKETSAGDPLGAEAISNYRLLETFRDTSLLEVSLFTGKRNQIRLQARLRGHTLVGERRYVYGPDALRPIAFARQALHARSLSFTHPESGQLLRFEASLPADLSELLARLRER